MTDQQESADTQVDKEHEELISKGKSLGLTQAANMKPSTLKKKIKEIESKEDEFISIGEKSRKLLTKSGFDFEGLEKWGKEMRFTGLKYIQDRNMFECYSGKHHVDNITIDAF